jgi:hypothetical protein
MIGEWSKTGRTRLSGRNGSSRAYSRSVSLLSPQSVLLTAQTIPLRRSQLSTVFDGATVLAKSRDPVL